MKSSTIYAVTSSVSYGPPHVAVHARPIPVESSVSYNGILDPTSVKRRVARTTFNAHSSAAMLPLALMIAFLAAQIEEARATIPAHLHLTDETSSMRDDQRTSIPLLGTKHVRPWSKVRDESHLFDEYVWNEPPPFIEQPHTQVNVERAGEFRITDPTFATVLASSVTPSKSTRAESEDLDRWRNKYLKEGWRNKPPSEWEVKPPTERERKESRFQSISHMASVFKNRGSSVAGYEFEDGLVSEDVALEHRHSSDSEESANRAVDITSENALDEMPGDVAEYFRAHRHAKPSSVQSRSSKLIDLVNAYEKQNRIDLKRKLTWSAHQLCTEERNEKVKPLLVAVPTRSETDWWEARLDKEFRGEYEQECNRALVRHEQWRRRALKLRHDPEFSGWAETFLKMEEPKPGEILIRSPYDPEPRGKLYTQAYEKAGNKVFHNYDSPFLDYVFIPSSKIPEVNKPSQKAIDAVTRGRKKFAPEVRILFGESTAVKEARRLKITEARMQKRVNSLKRELEKYETRGASMYDFRKLSPSVFIDILENGGSFVLVPGDTDDSLEAHRIDIGPDPLEIVGLRDGLSGHDSEHDWIGGARVKLLNDAIASIDLKNLNTGKRNRAIKAATARLDAKFAHARVFHFGAVETSEAPQLKMDAAAD